MFTTDSAETPTASTKRRVVALVHLVVLSLVWTAHLMVPYALASGNRQEATPPSGISVPAAAPRDPASYSQPAVVRADAPPRRAVQVVPAASAMGIPRVALAAYQRAETVINAADETCNIDWQLLAAVGHVESDHGRFGGSTVGDDGRSRPGIYGIPLDGTNDTQVIGDTDAGHYDRDKIWDRAVGPMQFIPTTWSTVGVDADGDGRRDPQNINDAVLAAAVFLCAGPDDLGNEAGRRTAVLRYNHSPAYADQVLAARAAYLKGGYAAVPDDTLSATSVPGPHRRAEAASARGPEIPKSARPSRGGDSTTAGSTSAPDRNGGGQTSGDGEPEATSPPTEKAPTSPPDQVEEEADGTLDKVAEPLPTPVSEPVDQVLTLAQAVTRCTADGVSRLDLLAWDRCIDDLVR